MALSCCCGSPNPPSQHGAARPSPITAVQDVAVNVVGKYRYRMTSPADSTWVPLIIDIILVGSRGVDNCWCLVVAGLHHNQPAHDPAAPCAHLHPSCCGALPVAARAGPCQWLQEPVAVPPPCRPAGGAHQDHHAAQRHLAGEPDRHVRGAGLLAWGLQVPAVPCRAGCLGWLHGMHPAARLPAPAHDTSRAVAASLLA